MFGQIKLMLKKSRGNMVKSQQKNEVVSFCGAEVKEVNKCDMIFTIFSYYLNQLVTAGHKSHKNRDHYENYNALNYLSRK